MIKKFSDTARRRMTIIEEIPGTKGVRMPKKNGPPPSVLFKPKRVFMVVRGTAKAKNGTTVTIPKGRLIALLPDRMAATDVEYTSLNIEVQSNIGKTGALSLKDGKRLIIMPEGVTVENLTDYIESCIQQAMKLQQATSARPI